MIHSLSLASPSPFPSQVSTLEEELSRTSGELSARRKSGVAVDDELRLKKEEAATLRQRLARCEDEIKDKEKVRLGLD